LGVSLGSSLMGETFRLLILRLGGRLLRLMLLDRLVLFPNSY
jgi:hypothetical protein